MSSGGHYGDYHAGTLSFIVKSLPLIRRSGARRWNLRVPDLQMSCSDLSYWERSDLVILEMAARMAWPIVKESMISEIKISRTLQWRHNERDGVSNHRRLDCLHNRFFQAQIKENIKAPRHWPLWGDFTGEFPAKGPVTRKKSHLMTSSWNQNKYLSGHYAIKLCGTNEWCMMHQGSLLLRLQCWCTILIIFLRLPPFRRRHFRMHFLQWKCLNLA